MHTFYFQLVCDFLPPSVFKGWSEVVVLNPLIPQTGSLFNQLGKSELSMLSKSAWCSPKLSRVQVFGNCVSSAYVTNFPQGT